MFLASERGLLMIVLLIYLMSTGFVEMHSDWKLKTIFSNLGIKIFLSGLEVRDLVSETSASANCQ